MERLAVVAVRQRRIGAMIQQRHGTVEIKTFATKMQWSFGVDVEGIHVGAVFEEAKNNRVVSLPSCPMEQGSSRESRSVDIGAVLNEEASDVRNAVHHRPEKRSFSKAVDGVQIEVF